MSKGCCSIGRRPDVGAINEALRQGGPTGTVRAVADRHHVNKTVLGDHRTKCLRLEGRTGKSPEPRPVAKPPDPPRPEPEPNPDKGADKPGQGGQEDAERPPVAPRARGPVDPSRSFSFEERSLCCADIIAAGQWDGHPTVSWLASVWHVDASTVRHYHRAAKVRCALDRGDTAALLEDTLGSLRRQEREAADQATTLEALAEDYEMMRADEDPETVEARANAAVRLRTTAAKYREIALKARSKYADVAGLVRTVLSIEQDPRVTAFVDYLLTALDALGEEIGRSLAAHAAQSGGVVPTLPDPRGFVEGKVAEYVAAGERGLPG